MCLVVCLVLTFFSEDSVMSRREGLEMRVLSFCVNPFFCEESVMSCRKNVRNVVCVLLAVVGLAFYASSVGATVVSPLNGSFEDPTVTDPAGYTSQLPTDWSLSPNATGNPGVQQPGVSGIYAAATDGSQILELGGGYYNWLPNPSWSVFGVQQDLGTMTTGETYTFGTTLFSNVNSGRCFYKISFYDMTDSRELASINETNFDPSALGSLKTLHASFSYRAAHRRPGRHLATNHGKQGRRSLL